VAQIENVCPMCGGTGFLFFKDLEPGHMALRRYSDARAAWTAYHNTPEEERAIRLWQGFCLYCKGIHIPRAGQGNREKHAQAREFRNKFEFASAISSYGDILGDDVSDYEAHWLRALSTHEIAEVGGSLFFFSAPHTHGPLCDDEDYREACKKARIISAADAQRYQTEAERLDRLRTEYMELNKKSDTCHVCVLVSPESVGQAQTFADYLKEKRSDLNLYIADPCNTSSEAMSCYAANTAEVMILMGNVGTFTQDSPQYRYWKPFAKRSNVRLVALTAQSLPEELDRVAGCVATGDGWTERLLEEVEKVHEPKQTVVQETTIIQETIIQGDDPTPELIEGAYQQFCQHDFATACTTAEKVLGTHPAHVPSNYILAFYYTFVQNTHNRGAVKNFFDRYGNARLDAADAAKMRNFFLISGSRLMPYEQTAVRMILNSEDAEAEKGKFADEFCSRLVPIRKDIYFMAENKEMYCDLARRYTAQKLCLALLSATRTNPESPVKENCFYLKTMAKNFREQYFVPLCDILSCMQNETVRNKFLAVYKKELENYDAKM